ncbi:MAG: cation transporter [Hyphomicrobiales bacterium]|nr:MAG: cation transporter [Hyphomicrobiales bacterium]
MKALISSLGQLKIAAIVSIAVAIVVMGLKYLAYWVTGSVALYSDALESIVNLVTAVAALYAIQISSRPADRNHQFGHHKAEYFAAVLEGVLIVVAALAILHEAYGAYLTPRSLGAMTEGLAINALAMVLNGAWATFLVRWGRTHRSPALVADGRHLFTDVFTSAGVLVGLALATITGWQALDPLLASLVALNILWSGWKLVTESMSGLMDEAVTTDVSRLIRKIISDNASGAIEAHDVKTRQAGQATFIEFHLVVPGDMTVAAAHEICDRIEAALEGAVKGAQILIHVEPEGEAKASGVPVL